MKTDLTHRTKTMLAFMSCAGIALCTHAAAQAPAPLPTTRPADIVVTARRTEQPVSE